MRRILALTCLVALAASSASAQTRGKFVIPSTNTLPRPNQLPFAGVPQRYQQWYSRNEALLGVDHPVRIIGIEFKALAGGATQAANLDMELALAHIDGTPGTHFDDNMIGKVVVAPRGTYPLAAMGTWPIAITFPPTNQFLWDGKSDIMLEVKLWGNGIPNNPPLTYDFENTVTGNNKVTRLWATGGNPNGLQNATTMRSGEGIVTRFAFEEGMTIAFGSGCRGDGGFVPQASTSGGLPFPGNVAWRQELRSAPSQRNAALILGTSDTKWGSINLPLDLAIIGGSGCNLFVEWVVALPSTTVGGGAGAGAVSLQLPIPPYSSLSLTSLYTQWIILDPNASNGMLTVSPGLWTIIG